jgi:ABC-type branched-subunit amino acid transport system permease subunit
MERLLRLLNGSEDIGRGPPFWAFFTIVLSLFIAVPLYLSEFAAYNVSYYLLNIPMALGLCILWGYCGV